jgi:hypothetical protein
VIELSLKRTSYFGRPLKVANLIFEFRAGLQEVRDSIQEVARGFENVVMADIKSSDDEFVIVLSLRNAVSGAHKAFTDKFVTDFFDVMTRLTSDIPAGQDFPVPSRTHR